MTGCLFKETGYMVKTMQQNQSIGITTRPLIVWLFLSKLFREGICKTAFIS